MSASYIFDAAAVLQSRTHQAWRIDPIKGIRALLNRRSHWFRVGAGIILAVVLSPGVAAEICLAPPRLFVPIDLEVTGENADLIRQDFELYIRDIQSYFLCLEVERARAFKEAREISEEYGRFLAVADD